MTLLKLPGLYKIGRDEKMLMNAEQGRIWKEEVMTYLRIYTLFRHPPRARTTSGRIARNPTDMRIG
jgi:hypothetical protein